MKPTCELQCHITFYQHTNERTIRNHHEKIQTSRLHHGTYYTLHEAHVLHIHGTTVQANIRITDGYTSITGSDQPIHARPPCKSSRVRMFDTHHLDEICILHSRNLETWKE